MVATGLSKRSNTKRPLIDFQSFSFFCIVFAQSLPKENTKFIRASVVMLLMQPEKDSLRLFFIAFDEICVHEARVA